MTEPGDGIEQLMPELDTALAHLTELYEQYIAAVVAAPADDRPRIIAEWRPLIVPASEQALLLQAGISDLIDQEAANMAAEAIAAAQPPAGPQPADKPRPA